MIEETELATDDGSAPADIGDAMLSVRCLVAGDTCFVEVAGELDVTSCARLTRAIEKSNCDLLVVDLEDVTFCDTRALETIIRLQHVPRESGRQIQIRPSAAVSRVIALTASQRFFDD